MLIDKDNVIRNAATLLSNEMGALTYEPEACIADSPVLPSDYDEISAECERILNSELSENDKQNLDAIFAAGGARRQSAAKGKIQRWKIFLKLPQKTESKNQRQGK